MRLAGIDCQVPSNKISNDEIIDLVKYYSAGFFDGNLQDLELIVKKLLKKTGITTRFWRNKKEKPIDLLNAATDRALRMARINKNQIDLVIYSSIDRGFIEPANASFICKILGLKDVRCFDIVDACMGWCSSLQVINSLFKSDQSLNYAMIINAEFPMDYPGTVLPHNFTINNLNELKWKFPSYTLGEGVSITIFEKKDSINSNFEFIESPQYADLCKIYIINHHKYSDNQQLLPDLQFYAAGSELSKNGVDLSVEVLERLLKKVNYIPKIIFPHSVSDTIIKEAVLKAKLESKVYSTFQELGNIATASVPSAIHKAILNNLIQKGDKCVGWIASAGMKFSAFEIQL